MLILTRKAGESITIGDNVRIHILGIKGGQVRIGVDAPRDVPVNREEIIQRKNHPNQDTVSEEPS